MTSEPPSVLKKKCFAFALRCVKMAKYLQAEEHEFLLSKQFMRSATAIGALIREAEHAESRADFTHKMSIALKEASETEYWLDLLHQSEYISTPMHSSMSQDIIELLKMLTATVKTSKRK